MKNITTLLSQLSELCNRCDTIRKQLISKLYTNRNRSVIAYCASTGYNIDSKGKEIKKTTFIVPRFSVETTSRRKDHSRDGVAHHRPLNTPFGKRIDRRRNSVGGSLCLYGRAIYGRIISAPAKHNGQAPRHCLGALLLQHMITRGYFLSASL